MTVVDNLTRPTVKKGPGDSEESLFQQVHKYYSGSLALYFKSIYKSVKIITFGRWPRDEGV